MTCDCIDIVDAKLAERNTRHDANMWRNSLKRSRDRKKVTK